MAVLEPVGRRSPGPVALLLAPGRGRGVVERHAVAGAMKGDQKRKARRKLASLFGWSCHYCRHELAEPEPYTDVFRTDPPEGKRWATLDHVVPKSLGGRNNIHNLVLACPDCNSDKGSDLR